MDEYNPAESHPFPIISMGAAFVTKGTVTCPGGLRHPLSSHVNTRAPFAPRLAILSLTEIDGYSNLALAFADIATPITSEAPEVAMLHGARSLDEPKEEIAPAIAE